MQVTPENPPIKADAPPILPAGAPPPRTEVVRHALKLSTTAWIFGSVWMSVTSGTPITHYANALGASKFQFGLLSALPYLASLLSMPASLLTEATGKRKRIFLWGLYLNRGMWFLIALAPLLLVRHYGMGSAGIAMGVFLWLVFMMHCGQAVGGPGWVAWMADLVPDRVRGKYFSRRRQWGILTAVPAAWLVGWLLDRHTGANDPHNMLNWCAGIFIVAAVFGLIDIHLFQGVPGLDRPPRKGGSLLKAMKEPLHNKQFLWFGGFVATLVFAVSFMGQFVTLYVMEQFSANGTAASMNSSTQMMLIIAPNVAMLFVLGAWGKAADRMGKKPLLIMAALGLVPVGAGWCLLTSGNVWLGFILAAAGAMLWAGVEVANLNLVLEFSGTAEDGKSAGGSAYFAVNAVIINIAGFLGGVSSGIIAEWLKDWTWVTAMKTFTFYDVLFALSALLRLAAVVIFLPHIHEADARPTHEAIRFMSANIYNNLYAAIQQPFKILGLKATGAPSPNTRRS